MGLVMTLAIALALQVLSASGVNANGVFELLWGSILATRSIDVLLLALTASVVVGLYIWRRRDLALLLYDREVALVSGVDVRGLSLLLLVVVAVAIGAAVRLTGALLVDSVTILPALAARNLGRSLGSMVAWAVVIGLFGNLLGFALTLIFNQPPGPLLVLTVGAITLATYLRRSAA
jgi:zinc transport system permease protein